MAEYRIVELGSGEFIIQRKGAFGVWERATAHFYRSEKNASEVVEEMVARELLKRNRSIVKRIIE